MQDVKHNRCLPYTTWPKDSKPNEKIFYKHANCLFHIFMSPMKS